MKRLEHFHALEGLDGAGTTTQVELIARRFVATGVAGRTTAEPTDGRIGRLIREVLSGATRVTPRTLAHLFAADRCEHLTAPTHGIEALVSRGITVVTDRYLFSSLAYQSIECGFNYVLMLNEFFALPSDLFYLEVSTDTALERSTAREKCEIFEHREFQESVRLAYLKALEWAESNGVIVHRIDGTEPPETIHEKIWNVISPPQISDR